MEQSYELTVREVVPETAEASSVVLEVPDDLADVFAYRPGQFLTIAVPSERDGVAARCYSLSSSPADGGPLVITIKRTAEGYASNWLLDHLRAGDTLRVLPPGGIFVPRDLDADLLLFAGGSGITPVLSIARTALAQGSGRVVLLYANRDESSVIFADALDELARAHPDRFRVLHWLESLQGVPDAGQLRALAADHASYDAFACGPAPFTKVVMTVLKEAGFPRERRHQEKFVSLGGNPFGDLSPADTGAAAALGQGQGAASA
ncbi:FAD-binding oxidoreductase [Nocardioides perillae]|uniref:3-ketosteroid 9alpha-monooxygenase subunit B n=1 Tax=Nocardioides perillae TaxID=1119534 RepID=A0A7Y9UKV2_9ACTN|nr:3-ketosteroid 9alpha-monooxygenase subunit B [Nocardioides perillae]